MDVDRPCRYDWGMATTPGIDCCAVCLVPFTYYGKVRRADGDPHVCERCYAEQIERERGAEPPDPPVEIEFPNPARLIELPPAHEDTAAELAAAAGEGPGPDDMPDPVDPWDVNHDEKLARLRLYSRDVLAGRRIVFIHKSTPLTADRLPAGRPIRLATRHCSRGMTAVS